MNPPHEHQSLGTSSFGSVELDFSGGMVSFGGSGNVSLTLGLQQDGGIPKGVSLAFPPAAPSYPHTHTSLLMYQNQKDQIHDSPYSLLDNQPQNLPYTHLVGSHSHLLHHLQASSSTAIICGKRNSEFDGRKKCSLLCDTNSGMFLKAFPSPGVKTRHERSEQQNPMKLIWSSSLLCHSRWIAASALLSQASLKQSDIVKIKTIAKNRGKSTNGPDLVKTKFFGLNRFVEPYYAPHFSGLIPELDVVLSLFPELGRRGDSKDYVAELRLVGANLLRLSS
ncbi:homeobox protein BEL1-like protein [Senna tora]|uniref:Homeobox protein BEL1-like protein n=1 Tax=Senna tora TaxID=362788 RepID=A0A834U207_9FABA|nr:homeobox protein BEL1-like protein [Senna tora]